MRMIGTLNTEEEAATFSNYLLTAGIDAHIEEGANGWQVWIEHDDHLDRGRGEFDVYRANPNDPRFSAAGEAARIRREREKAAERRQKNYQDVRTSSAWSGVTRYGTPVAIGMVLISIALTLLTGWGERYERPLTMLLYDDPSDVRVLRHPNGTQETLPGQTMFTAIKRGQVWRLVTPIFLHGSPMHLLFNMLWIWQLGRVIEALKGSGKFVLLCLAIAVISNTAEAAWISYSPFTSQHWTPFLGMSGVVAGLFGYAWMKGKFQPWERLGVDKQTVGLMLGWLVICSLGVVGDIANAAHWFGLLTGMAMGTLPRFLRKSRR